MVYLTRTNENMDNEMKITERDRRGGDATDPRDFTLRFGRHNKTMPQDEAQRDSDSSVIIETPPWSEIDGWGEETFPHSTPHDICNHLVEEVEELREAVIDVTEGRRDDASEDEVAEEIADVFLILLHLSYCFGVDLLETARSKM